MFNRIFPAAVCLVLGLTPANAAGRYVALTFDDGPTAYFTETVLDLLKRERVPATFFVIGQKVQRSPYLLKRIAAEGHEIGNHTYTHSKVTWINDAKTASELRRTSLLVGKLTGRKVRYFRPPHGTISAAKRKMIAERGYKTVLWTVNADDFWHRGRGMREPSSIARRILSRIHGDEIVLMHDDSLQLREALATVIGELKRRHYSFVTVSEFLKRRAGQKARRLDKRFLPPYVKWAAKTGSFGSTSP